jgi:hypothetical protein
MLRILTLVLVLVSWLSGVAIAQELGGLPPLDPTGWGASPFTFGAFLTLVIATIKRGVETSTLAKYGQVVSNPWLWRGVGFTLSIAGAFGLHLSKFGAELLLFGLVSPWSVLLFALASWLVSMGYRDFLKSALGWVGQASAARAPAVTASTDIQPPASVKAAPPVGGLPSGIEPIGLPSGAQGFLGGGVLAFTLDMLLAQVLGEANLEATPTRLARIGARLVQVAPDLLDGDAHLSVRSRQVILGVVLDLKKEGKLI